MKKFRIFILFLFCFLILIASSAKEGKDTSETSKLAVVWTSGDKDVAIKMVFMYTYNAKKQGWWDEVQLIVWGPSSKLLSDDADLQDYVKKMRDSGVDLKACIVCANMYGVTDKLRELGIDVKAMGKPLTDLLKSDWKVVSF